MKRTPLRRVSTKHAAELKLYNKQCMAFKLDNQLCEVELPGCNRYTQDVHHTAGRGPNLNKVETWMAVCRSCHNWIHNHPGQARELGLIV